MGASASACRMCVFVGHCHRQQGKAENVPLMHRWREKRKPESAKGGQGVLPLQSQEKTERAKKRSVKRERMQKMMSGH